MILELKILLTISQHYIQLEVICKNITLLKPLEAPQSKSFQIIDYQYFTFTKRNEAITSKD